MRINNLVPDYLCSIIRPENPPVSSITTRQISDIPLIPTRGVMFAQSFYPSTIRAWNELPLHVRNSASLTLFKNKITRSVIRPIKYSDLYFLGDRYLAILHTRLRLGASQLNSHLFKIGVKDSPKCSCGAKY